GISVSASPQMILFVLSVPACRGIGKAYRSSLVGVKALRVFRVGISSARAVSGEGETRHSGPGIAHGSTEHSVSDGKAKHGDNVKPGERRRRCGCCLPHCGQRFTQRHINESFVNFADWFPMLSRRTVVK